MASLLYLNYFVDGEGLYQIKIGYDEDVGRMQEHAVSSLRRYKKQYHDLDASDLLLYLIKDQIVLDPEETLDERVEYLLAERDEDIAGSEGLTKLKPNAPFSEFFHTQPNRRLLHVLVEIPEELRCPHETSAHSFSTSHLDDIVDSGLPIRARRGRRGSDQIANLVDVYWGKSLSNIISHDHLDYTFLRSAELNNRPGEIDDDVASTSTSDEFVPVNSRQDEWLGCGIISGHGLRHCPDIYIRDEYIRIYDELVKHGTIALRQSGVSLSAVITGEPGIGKSMWLLYALIRRLSKGLPTVYHTSDRMLLFYDGVAYLLPSTSEFTGKQLRFGPETMILVDVHECSFDPASLVNDSLMWYLVYTSYPEERRWSRLQDKTICSRIIMDSWSYGEILSLARVSKFPSEKVSGLCRSYGNNPRTIFRCQIDSHYESTLQQDLNCACIAIASGSLQSIVQDLASLREPAQLYAHKVFGYKRVNRDDIRSSWVIIFVSPEVQSRVSAALESVWYTDESLEKLEKLWEVWEPTREVARVVAREVIRRRVLREIKQESEQKVTLITNGVAKATK